MAASKCLRYRTINLGSRSFVVLLPPHQLLLLTLLSFPSRPGLCQFQNIPRPPLMVSKSSRPGTHSLGRSSSS